MHGTKEHSERYVICKLCFDEPGAGSPSAALSVMHRLAQAACGAALGKSSAVLAASPQRNRKGAGSFAPWLFT